MVLLSVRKPTILGPIAFKATYVANFQYTAIFQPTTIKYLNNGCGTAQGKLVSLFNEYKNSCSCIYIWQKAFLSWK